ncbi:hypothetical protein ACO3UB_00410 [Methanocaldococcus sp. 16A]
MESKNDFMINIFKIDTKNINLPKKAYLYKINIEENLGEQKLQEIYKTLANTYGHVDENNILYSYRRVKYLPPNIKNVTLITHDTLNLDELPNEISREVLRVYFKNVLKKDVRTILRNLEEKYLPKNTVGNWNIY